mmetsp:Transcript_17758/g.55992  ORF Transcript_17758/g.55992 Transcript_17758/m.55992 type:complete len:274 (+) Transcript_17758:57-878(+)
MPPQRSRPKGAPNPPRGHRPRQPRPHIRPEDVRQYGRGRGGLPRYPLPTRAGQRAAEGAAEGAQAGAAIGGVGGAAVGVGVGAVAAVGLEQLTTLLLIFLGPLGWAVKAGVDAAVLPALASGAFAGGAICGAAGAAGGAAAGAGVGAAGGAIAGAALEAAATVEGAAAHFDQVLQGILPAIDTILLQWNNSQQLQDDDFFQFTEAFTQQQYQQLLRELHHQTGFAEHEITITLDILQCTGAIVQGHDGFIEFPWLDLNAGPAFTPPPSGEPFP